MQERADTLGSASPMTSNARLATPRASGKESVGEGGFVMAVALPSATYPALGRLQALKL